MIVSLDKFKKLAQENENIYISRAYPGEDYRIFIFGKEGIQIKEVSHTVVKTLSERGILTSFPMYNIVKSKLHEIE